MIAYHARQFMTYAVIAYLGEMRQSRVQYPPVLLFVLRWQNAFVALLKRLRSLA